MRRMNDHLLCICVRLILCVCVRLILYIGWDNFIISYLYFFYY